MPIGPNMAQTMAPARMCIRWRHVPCHHLGEEVVEGLVGVGDQQSALTRTVVVQHLYTKTPSTASINSVRRVPTSHRIHSIGCKAMLGSAHVWRSQTIALNTSSLDEAR